MWQKVTIEVPDKEGETIRLKAYSVPKFCHPLPRIPWNTRKTRWPHHADLPLRETGRMVDWLFDWLLGIDHADVLLRISHYVDKKQEPYAIETRLGRVVRGLPVNRPYAC